MTYKEIEIDYPTVDMIQEYIDLKGFKNLSAEKIFNLYEQKGWKSSDGTTVETIESVVNYFNGRINPNSSYRKRKLNNTEQYKELLQTEEWKCFRDKVIELHNNKCDKCEETDNLQVHHKAYRGRGKQRRLPWGYFFNDMEVLCEKHHAEAHNVKYINKV